MTEFKCPELRPGWTYLKGQLRPAWLLEADANYRDSVEMTNRMHEIFDGLQDVEYGTSRYLDIQSAIFSAQAHEIECMKRSFELYDVWQSGGHPVVFHQSMVIQTSEAMR